MAGGTCELERGGVMGGSSQPWVSCSPSHPIFVVRVEAILGMFFSLRARSTDAEYMDC